MIDYVKIYRWEEYDEKDRTPGNENGAAMILVRVIMSVIAGFFYLTSFTLGVIYYKKKKIQSNQIEETKIRIKKRDEDATKSYVSIQFDKIYDDVDYSEITPYYHYEPMNQHLKTDLWYGRQMKNKIKPREFNVIKIIILVLKYQYQKLLLTLKVIWKCLLFE